MILSGVDRAMRRIDEIQSKIKGILGESQKKANATGEKRAFSDHLTDASAQGPASPEALRPHFKAAAAKYGLDPRIIEAVAKAESAFNTRAVSKKNAQGVMQIIPDTQKLLGVTDPFDPGQSIDGGARYLRMMLDKFGGNLPNALAAYNAGPQAVERHKGIPPIPETNAYVRRILSDLGSSAQEGIEY